MKSVKLFYVLVYEKDVPKNASRFHFCDDCLFGIPMLSIIFIIATSLTDRVS